MPSSAAAVPTSSDLLCTGCGYVLSGLPNDSRCPECGTLITESDPSLRGVPDWERHPGSPAAFVRTTAAVLVTPTRFFRTLATRADRLYSRRFAMVHFALAALFFAVAAENHLQYTEIHVDPRMAWLLFAALWVASLISLMTTNRVAAWLTHWEGTYRGLRMPTAAVRRTMDYHSANYPLVAAIAALTVVVFTRLDAAGRLPAQGAMVYFYVLSGEVIAAAVYLFQRYWTAMRNVMYANA